MKIIKILDASQIDYAKNLIEDLEFHDGKKTALGLAKKVKLVYQRSTTSSTMLVKEMQKKL